MNNLLAALGSDIKPAGKNKWVCRCPVHNDKDFAMSIKQLGNGKVIANCFSCGANGLDLYRALGLGLDELFGGEKLAKSHIPADIKDQYIIDRLVQIIASNDIDAGHRHSLADKRRLKLADARVVGIESKYQDIKLFARF